MAEVGENVMEELSISVDAVPSLPVWLYNARASSEQCCQVGFWVLRQSAWFGSEEYTAHVELEDWWIRKILKKKERKKTVAD